jgi:hypothetical protein
MPPNENAAKYFSRLKGVKQSENLLHKQLCQWMKMQYPNIVFRSGMEGFHLSEQDAQFATIINSHTGFPDLLIFERRGPSVGLAIELKKEGAPLYKKDRTTLRKSEHLERQASVLALLAERGWSTCFAQGWDEAVQTIKDYLNLTSTSYSND